MSGDGRAWGLPERILLVVVLILAVLAAFRLATRESATGPNSPPVQTDAGQRPVDAAASPAAGPPPSPACAEVLARIRSCSGKDLDAIVDQVSGLEAYNLYRQLSPSDRQEVFSALPAPTLARKAKELLGIPETSFRHVGKPGLLASSLVEVAMAAPGGSSEAPCRGLRFATAVDELGAPQGPRSIFRFDERKIYACLDAESESDAVEPGVLVRWYEEGSGALVYLRYLPLAVNRRWNNVYFEVKDRWNPGFYRVRLYRIGQTATLLADGTYTVGKD